MFLAITVKFLETLDFGNTLRLITIMTSTSVFRTDCLQGRVALVTGGGSGICFEVTRQLLQHGCSAAVICGRRRPFLERSSMLLREETGKQCDYHVCDVRNSDMCQEAVKFVLQRFGRLDILVNGAAGNFLAEAKDLTPKGCVWREGTMDPMVEIQSKSCGLHTRSLVDSHSVTNLLSLIIFIAPDLPQ
jgi:NAD(P)-dependent dehydrogenase (short-subunit alcohol dehydrogenase family)